MESLMRVFAVFLTTLLMNSVAYSQLRTIELPANKGWQHAGSGIILTKKLSDLSRESLQDYGKEELDIAAQFYSEDHATNATLYIFRPAVNRAQIWFEQSRGQIELTDKYGLNGQKIDANPETFAIGTNANPVGLKIIYPTNSNGYISTSLAIVPVGEWLFALRLSSKKLNAAAMHDEMDSVIKAVRFPSNLPDAPTAKPIEMCATPLKFEDAKIVKSDGHSEAMESLIGAGLSAQLKNKHAEQPVQPIEYCKDQSSTLLNGIYRANASDISYVMAHGDAGISTNVGLSILGQLLKDKKQRYSVTHERLDQSIVYPSFDKLPSPAQVNALISNGSPLSRTIRGSNTTTIYMPATK